MDLREDMLGDLENARDANVFFARLVYVAAGRSRCPRVAAYRRVTDGYRRIAAVGRDLPMTFPGLPPTVRNTRNILLPGAEPQHPPAFLRLEWDGPEIHDPEAVEALEDVCVAAASLIVKLP